MKAVIIEKKGKYAVALTKNGEFIKTRNKDSFKVGYEIDIASSSAFSTGMLTKITAAAASVLLFIGVGYGAYSYAMPYSYINIDINPSIEVTTNVFDRIIKVRGLNEDGEKVLSSVNARNKEVGDAIVNILQSAEKNGYLGGDSENAVMFTVSGKNKHKVEEIEKKVGDTAEKQLKASSVKTEVVVENVTLERHEKAEDMGVSPGKMLLIEKLEESDPNVDIESYKDAPVKEIMKKIIADKKANDDKAKISGKTGNEAGKDKNEQGSRIKDDDKQKEKLSVKYKGKNNTANKNISTGSIKDNDKDKEKNSGSKADNSQKYKSGNENTGSDSAAKSEKNEKTKQKGQ